MRKLIRYLRGYEKETVIAPLFKMLEATFELIVPLVMAYMIDVGVHQNGAGELLKSGSLLVLLGVLGLVCSLTAQYYSAKAAVGMGTALRHDLFAHIQNLSYTELDQVGSATLITRMTSDVNQVQAGINLLLRLLLRSPFIVVGAMAMAFTINVPVALIFVVTIPVLSLIIYGIIATTIPLYKKVQKRLERLLLLTRENLSGMRVVRAFCTQDREREAFEEESTRLLALQMLVGKISSLMNPTTYIVVNAATIAIVWKGGEQVAIGSMTQGEVIAMVNYMTQILIALIALANLIVTYTKGMASASRINEVMALRTSMVSGEAVEGKADTPMVVFEQVDMAYQGSPETAINGIHWKVQRGETVGIIGGTGSGKSTLVQLIPRCYDATKGQVLVAGVDVREWDIESLRQRIGIVPQKPVLFEGTLRDNMKMGKEEVTDEEIYEALRIAQIDELVKERKEGLEMWISPNGKNLSGGQRQRLTIARAIVKQPEILILDDSASALDYATDARLRKAMEEKKGTQTIFIVSQRAASVREADQIVVMEDGSIAGMGTHEELLKDCAIYREICQSQLTKEEVSAHA